MTDTSGKYAGSTVSDQLLATGLQKIDFRLLLSAPEGFDTDVADDALLKVFGDWRLEKGEEIHDLADYSHVPHGPGVLLVSKRWHFGVDWEGGQPALFFSTRRGLSGGLAERLVAAFRNFLGKSARLLAHPDFPSALTPRCGDVEIVINDRLLFPNSDASDQAVRPAVDALVEKLYGGGAATIERETDPRRRLGYRVTAPAAGATIDSLLAQL